MAKQLKLLGAAIEGAVRDERADGSPITRLIVRRKEGPDVMVPLLGKSVVFDGDATAPQDAPADLQRHDVMGAGDWAPCFAEDGTTPAPRMASRRLVIVEGELSVESWGDDGGGWCVVRGKPTKDAKLDALLKKIPKAARKDEVDIPDADLGWKPRAKTGKPPVGGAPA